MKLIKRLNGTYELVIQGEPIHEYSYIKEITNPQDFWEALTNPDNSTLDLLVLETIINKIRGE